MIHSNHSMIKLFKNRKSKTLKNQKQEISYLDSSLEQIKGVLNLKKKKTSSSNNMMQ